MTIFGQPIRTGLSFDDVLLVPHRTRVRSRADVDTTVDLAPGVRLWVPVIGANTQWCTGGAMAAALARVGGLGFVHRMQTVERQATHIASVKSGPVGTGPATVDPVGRLLVGAAVGTKGDYLDRAALMVEHGADLLLVDVAHGHSDQVIDTVGKLHARHPRVPIVAGNVATAGGTNDLLDAGADVVKVGIGPGGVCTTRLVAGSGVPQLTAIIDCAHAAAQRDATVIADGGVRQSGDLAKALAAGAAAVMLGSALAGADESEAGVVDLPDGSRYRCSRGFATLGMANTLRAAAGGRLTRDDVVGYIPEGVEMTFAPSGPVADTVYQLVGGLRSAMSYTGAADMAEFRRLAEFIRVTPAGRAENAPHAAERAPQPAPDFRAEAVAQI